MTTVTIGGVTVGLGILIWQLIEWWPGFPAIKKDPLGQLAALLPFLVAWAYGVLAILTVGGLIGWAADSWLWINNWLGDTAIVWGVGGQAGQSAGAVTFVPLSQTGGALVLLMTIGIIGAARRPRWGSDIKKGTWCGICLGTSAGIAGFAAVPLAIAANWAGAHVYGAIAAIA